jgi:hypothetical protein
MSARVELYFYCKSLVKQTVEKSWYFAFTKNYLATEVV